MTKAECLKKRTFTVGKKDIYKRRLERKISQKGLVFLLFLRRTENLIIQWVSENVLIEVCHVFNIYCSGNETR